MEQDHSRIAQYVKAHRLEAIFDEETIKEMKLLTYEKGQALCAAGDQLQHLYLLVKGKIKVYTLLPNGKSVLLRFNEPLAVIGDMELMTGYPVRCTVESVGQSLFIAIKTDVLRARSCHDPRFLTYIIQLLSHKLYTAANASSLNLLYPVENRLASYLLSISPEACIQPKRDEMRTEKLTELAELLGTSYRHLNRIITKLEKEDVITRKRGSIVIRDMQRMKELASGNLYQ
ncbi:Crp/Fnr family transcriptional regulator [Paenibacillus sp. MCAF20]